MSYLFIKNCLTENSLYYFHKKIKNKKKTKNQKKNIFSGFFRWVFWVFWVGFSGWVFYCQPWCFPLPSSLQCLPLPSSSFLASFFSTANSLLPMLQRQQPAAVCGGEVCGAGVQGVHHAPPHPVHGGRGLCLREPLR